MGLTKKENFSSEVIELADMAKALAHPARIAILKHLLQTNVCMCGDIVEALPLAQSTVSQHLKELKKVGLLKGNIEGTSICYCVDAEVLSQIKERFATFFDLWVECCKDDCC